MIRQIMFTVFILTKIGAIAQDKHIITNEPLVDIPLKTEPCGLIAFIQ